VEDDVPVDSKIFLVTDFVNFKIKLAQSFKDAHRNMVCVRVFIRLSVHMCISISIYTVFLKKISCTSTVYCGCVTLIVSTYDMSCVWREPITSKRQIYIAILS
jgi:hypothetical protein